MVKTLLMAVILGGLNGYLVCMGVYHVTHNLLLEGAVGIPLTIAVSYFMGIGFARWGYRRW
jgi:hypothetical protein